MKEISRICTWRTFLGGIQYSNIFPTFLGEWLGLGSIPWIWKYCPDFVVEGIAGGLGDEQTRRLIMEYRAKLALLDMKKWSNACKKLLNDNFGRSIGPEWEPYWINCDTWTATPYVKTNNDGNGLLTPEQRTTPGWSGANEIPLEVSGDIVTVDFQPIGQNMSCQLCYRATDGTAVYSIPVTSGTCSLRLDKAPAGNVVIAVICNTDYVYNGEETRKAHYDYRLQLVSGVSGAADIYTKWYDVDLAVKSATPPKVKTDETSASKNDLRVSNSDKQTIKVSHKLSSPSPVSISIFSTSGSLLKSISGFRASGDNKEYISTSDTKFSTGAYIVKLQTNTVVSSKKVLVIK